MVVAMVVAMVAAMEWLWLLMELMEARRIDSNSGGTLG